MADSSEIEVRRDQRDTGTVLQPIGDVDLSRAPSLRSHLVQSIEAKPPRLVVNMDAVHYMDSAGVATLIEAMTLARTAAVPFFLCALNKQVMDTLQITRLDGVFTITDDVDAALTM
ncbi:MAG: STAS domain-containing protein [Phycisphaerales bacterium]